MHLKSPVHSESPLQLVLHERASAQMCPPQVVCRGTHSPAASQRGSPSRPSVQLVSPQSVSGGRALQLPVEQVRQGPRHSLSQQIPSTQKSPRAHCPGSQRSPLANPASASPGFSGAVQCLVSLSQRGVSGLKPGRVSSEQSSSRAQPA